MKVAIIGGGIVGTAIALNLQRAGMQATLYDRAGERPPASWGNAGHLATEQVIPPASIQSLLSLPRRLFMVRGPAAFPPTQIGCWGPWALRFLRYCTPAATARGTVALTHLLADALPAWERLAGSLGAPECVQRTGHQIVWESAGSARAGEAAWRSAPTGTASVRPLEPMLLARLNGQLKVPLAGGVSFTQTGQVSDPADVLVRMRLGLQVEGGALHEIAVRNLVRDAGRVGLVLEDGGTRAPDLVVVAAGVGSGTLMSGIGHVVPIIAERGYHLQGEDGGWQVEVPVVFEDRNLIIVRLGGRLRVTSFVEFSRAEAPADARKWARLRQHVDELGLPLRAPLTEWMGARPTLPDYLPAIGRSRRAANLFYAFGHQHLGLTLAATTGELMAHLVQGRSLPLDIGPFDLDRFDKQGAATST